MSPFPSKQWGEEPQESTSWGWEQREHGPRAGGSSGPQEGPAGGGGEEREPRTYGELVVEGEDGEELGGHAKQKGSRQVRGS